MRLDPHLAHRSLLESGPHPRLAWSGHGERFELSGRVLGTWGAKIANLLVEEDVAGPGARVLIDLPDHWRTVTWALGTWLAGACVVLPWDPSSDQDAGTRALPDPGAVPDGAARLDLLGPVDLVVSSVPERWASAATGGIPLVAVPLPSFALRWPGPLPAGVAFDGAADVSAQPDDLGPVPPFDAAAPALELTGATYDFGDVPEQAWSAVGHLAAWMRGENAVVDARNRDVHRRLDSQHSFGQRAEHDSLGSEPVTTSAPAIVRVVTVFYNSRDALPRFLGSIRAATTRAVEIVIVDNASPVPLRTDELPDGIRVLGAPVNLGYGAGANHGVADACTEWVVIANPDVSWRPGSLDILLEHAATHPDAAVFGPAVHEPNGDLYPSARAFPSIGTGIGHALLSRVWPGNPWSRAYRQEGAEPSADRATDWLSGSCLLVRRSALVEVGGFDEDYFMFFEDVDLCWRLAQRGWSSVYVPSAEVDHDQGHSWRSRPAAMLRAHHESAYLYLSRRYPHSYQAPLRLALRAGLAARLWWQTRGSVG